MTTLPLCRLDELAEGTAKRFDVAGQRLALARIGEALARNRAARLAANPALRKED